MFTDCNKILTINSNSMKTKLLIFCLLLTSISLAQYNPNRYKKQIFTATTPELDTKYGAAPKWVFPYLNEDLKLNVYKPSVDPHQKRPLLIMAHAGGFLNGSKGVDDMVAMCDSFARRGFVTATIDYRKGFNPLDGESAERAVYRGIQDGKAAVRYFKEKASTYGIDTNYIFFGGMSAGGYIALHVAYMDRESERPQSTYGGGTVNNLGCLDCAGNTYPHSSKVRGILDFWGALQDTTIIEAGNVPALIMHGANDPTVPYEYGHPFGLGTLPETYGGLPISQRLNNLGVHNEFITSHSSLHMLDGSDNGTFPSSGPNAFWKDTLIPRSTNFLFELIKPRPTALTTTTVYACTNDVFNLNVQPDGTEAFYWVTPAGVTVETNTVNGGFQASIVGTHRIGYVEVNHLLAFSDTLWFEVVTSDFTPSFNFVNTSGSVAFATQTYSNYNWTINNGTYTTASPVVNLVSGTYTVDLTVTNDLGCTKSVSQQIVINNLAITTESGIVITVYPNPAVDVISIEGSLLEGNFKAVELIDLSGRLVMTSEINSNLNQIDVSHLNSGVYMLNLIGAEKATIKVELVK